MKANEFLDGKLSEEQRLAIQLISSVYPGFYEKSAREDESMSQSIAVAQRVFKAVKENF